MPVLLPDIIITGVVNNDDASCGSGSSVVQYVMRELVRFTHTTLTVLASAAENVTMNVMLAVLASIKTHLHYILCLLD